MRDNLMKVKMKMKFLRRGKYIGFCGEIDWLLFVSKEKEFLQYYVEIGHDGILYYISPEESALWV